MMKRVVNRGKITAQTGPLAFIGGGAMTEAIIKGILGPDWLTRVRSLSASRQRHAVNITETYGIKASAIIAVIKMQG
ncbi:MAG: hypothetical protein ACLRXQ_00860 [Phascolarctobacterium faecium]